MKPLINFDRFDSAILLHELFPSEIPDFLHFVLDVYQTIRQDECMYRKYWNRPFCTFEDWLEIAYRVSQNIEKYPKELTENPRFFAEHLFDGFFRAYTLHCILLYTTVREHPNQKFALMVKLLFG